MYIIGKPKKQNLTLNYCFIKAELWPTLNNIKAVDDQNWTEETELKKKSNETFC